MDVEYFGYRLKDRFQFTARQGHRAESQLALLTPALRLRLALHCRNLALSHRFEASEADP
jgi:hypothetical protein